MRKDPKFAEPDVKDGKKKANDVTLTDVSIAGAFSAKDRPANSEPPAKRIKASANVQAATESDSSTGTAVGVVDVDADESEEAGDGPAAGLAVAKRPKRKEAPGLTPPTLPIKGPKPTAPSPTARDLPLGRIVGNFDHLDHILLCLHHSNSFCLSILTVLSLHVFADLHWDRRVCFFFFFFTIDRSVGLGMPAKVPLVRGRVTPHLVPFTESTEVELYRNLDKLAKWSKASACGAPALLGCWIGTGRRASRCRIVEGPSSMHSGAMMQALLI
jgi:hypothetical protein